MQLCEVAISMRLSDYRAMQKDLDGTDSVLLSAYCYTHGEVAILYWSEINWEWEYNCVDVVNTWLQNNTAPWIYLIVEKDTHNTVYDEIVNGSYASEIAKLRGFFEPAIALNVDYK